MGLKVSIITATFNSERTIRRSLLSVQSQNYGNTEHIIVDGKSSDSTLAIVKEHATPNTRVISENDRGIYDALNKGIRLATGDVVGFLHSDDSFQDSSSLFHTVAKIESGFDVVYADLIYVNESDGKIVRLWKSGVYRRFKLFLGWMPPHPTFYCRREVYRDQLYDAGFKISGDYKLMLSILTRKGLKVGYVPQVTVRMQLGGKSNAGFLNILRKSYEDIKSLRSVGLFPYVALIAKNVSKLGQFFLH